MDFLPTLWFILIAVLWTGYLFLEGFDLGVGMLMKLFARSERDKRLLLNTIGPVWDGNEVWLLTAGGATFAAFPLWYASLFSALYVPLVLVLIGLIFRAVAVEYRGKAHSQRNRHLWDWALSLGSFVAAFGVGAMLALSTTGLPLDANGDRVGGPFVWLNGYAILGGLGVVLFCLVQGLAFLGLKTDGDVRHRADAWLSRALPWAVLPLAAWAIVAIFGSAYPVVLPSSLNSAWDLTVETASSSPYTLKLMSIVACIGVPLVLAYQAWSYWVFRKRLSGHHLPEAHPVSSLV
jgi:cytochrome d ubiquinol oxidase subunit II